MAGKNFLYTVKAGSIAENREHCSPTNRLAFNDGSIAFIEGSLAGKTPAEIGELFAKQSVITLSLMDLDTDAETMVEVNLRTTRGGQEIRHHMQSSNIGYLLINKVKYCITDLIQSIYQ